MGFSRTSRRLLPLRILAWAFAFGVAGLLPVPTGIVHARGSVDCEGGEGVITSARAQDRNAAPVRSRGAPGRGPDATLTESQGPAHQALAVALANAIAMPSGTQPENAARLRAIAAALERLEATQATQPVNEDIISRVDRVLGLGAADPTLGLPMR